MTMPQAARLMPMRALIPDPLQIADCPVAGRMGMLEARSMREHYPFAIIEDDTDTCRPQTVAALKSRGNQYEHGWRS